MQLAQFNISISKADLDQPLMQEFISGLAEVNQLADVTKGFVWRLKDEHDNAIAISAYDDPRIIFNLSVWESIDTLKQFVYKSKHTDVLRKRSRWFKPGDKYSYVLWWVPNFHKPSLEEAKSQLAYLQQHGESPRAFTFRKPYSIEDVMQIKAESFS